MPVFRLDDSVNSFPHPKYAEDDGFLAIGGDLSVPRLLLAYSNGIFPWYDEGQEILWWCPHTRFIIRPGEIHISHSMRKFMKKHTIECAVNRNFADTMHRCRTKREFTVGTWIHDDMETAYKRLYDAGYAMAFEAYIDGELAGGLYGVVIGKCFFGESMYSDLENGSKLALIGLARMLEARGFVMIDCQFHTDHLESMGGVSIEYDEYQKLLRA